VTEIPEHLLARSKARRQAIGQDEVGGAADAPAAAGAVEKAAPAAAAPAGPSGVGELAPAKAPVAAAAAPPPPKRPEVIAAESRKKMPWWAAVAFVSLPVWAFLFAYTLEPPTQASAALTAGESIYGAQCAGCHQSGGGGTEGVFPGFTDGDVILTFPNYEDQVTWVETGTDGANPDGTYGSPDRPGGPHSTSLFSGSMPPFADTLSEEQILEVVRYEREVLAEHGCEPALAEATGEVCAPGTEAEAAAP
jgi:mono/diheme cytochrome c family protein